MENGAFYPKQRRNLPSFLYLKRDKPYFVPTNSGMVTRLIGNCH